MAPPVFNVSLPLGTITIVAPAQTASNNPLTFPHLKLKVTPKVNVPADLAPSNLNGKKLEEDIKVVVPVGGKVSVSWKVNPEHLPLEEDCIDLLTAKVQVTVGEWLALNQENLGVDSFDYPESSSAISNGGGLIFTPTSSLPSLSPLEASLIPSGEPVAHLTSIDIAVQWSYPSIRSRKRPAEDQFDFNVLFPDAAEATQDETQIEDETSGDMEIDIEAEALAQVGLGMQKVMRLQMIRRFPYVFDGRFIEYQRSLSIPSALFDAVNRFVTLSAKFGTNLVNDSRQLFEQLQESQSRTLVAQVNAMARLPIRARLGKRPKLESQQTSSQPSLAQSQEQQQEEERMEKVVDYLECLRLDSDEKSTEDRLYSAIAQGLSAIGIAQWMQVRVNGRGRMSAYKAFLQEPEHFQEAVPSFADDPSEEDVWDVQTPIRPLPGQYLFEDQDQGSLSVLQEPYHAFPGSTDGLDDLDDLDAEDCYDGDSDESLYTAQLSYSDLLSAPRPAQSYVLGQYRENALELQFEGPSSYPSSYIRHESHFEYHQHLSIPGVDEEHGSGGDGWRSSPSTSAPVQHGLQSMQLHDPRDDLEDIDDDAFLDDYDEDPAQQSFGISQHHTAPISHPSYQEDSHSHHSFEPPRFADQEQHRAIEATEEAFDDFDDFEGEEMVYAAPAPPAFYIENHSPVTTVQNDVRAWRNSHQDDLLEDDLEECSDNQVARSMPDVHPLYIPPLFNTTFEHSDDLDAVDDLDVDDLNVDDFDVDDRDVTRPVEFSNNIALNVEHHPSFPINGPHDDLYDDLDDW